MSQKDFYTVFCCTNIGTGRCGDKGGEEVWGQLVEEAKAKGLSEEQAVLARNGCTGLHHLGPVVIVMNDKEETWYGRVTPADAAEIVNEHIRNGRVVDRLLIKRTSAQE